jgi:hypothetical protein
MNELGEAYKRATGRSHPSVLLSLAWFIVKTNKATQELYFSLPPSSFRLPTPS